MAEEANTKKEEVQQQKDEGTIKIPKKTAYFVVGIILVFIIGFAFGRLTAGPTGAVVAGGSGGGLPSNGGSGVKISVSVDDAPFFGDENAPITIIEFSDFECPFCARFYSQTLPQLKSEYGDTIIFYYRHFPLSQIHPEAEPSARAAECANDQGKFWEFHDLLFENQQLWARGDAEGTFKNFAQQLSLDTSEFNSCFDSGKHKSKVQKDLQDGISAGVSGTPTFFVGNDKDGYTKLVGAQPFGAFQAAIEAAL